MASEKSFELRIITPDRVFYEGSAEMVEMDTREGAIGVYKSHVPTTWRAARRSRRPFTAVLWRF